MIYNNDSYLMPYKKIINERYQYLVRRKQEISGYGRLLSSVANNHLYYMAHKEKKYWVFREWAPNATAIYLIGNFNNWEKNIDFSFTRIDEGNWELKVPINMIKHLDLYKWIVQWNGGEGERIPAYAYRCIQDKKTKIFSAQIWDPKESYKWKSHRIIKKESPLIYEVHIGMSSREEKVSTFNEFRENVLPYINKLGYNTIQIMALQEHPYYGSFGYQVSSFFAVSSRFGTPDDFKRLVDEAHSLGIAVIMDIVHSHAVDNEVEGLGLLDGTPYLYFHDGPRGHHPAWGSRCFDYGKDTTVKFLLSNLKFWMEEYRLDGFRFDGVTSMIYYDHGLGTEFLDYSYYYNGNQDGDAIVYLALANILVKEINSHAITIAEDVSGMPGLASPILQGGTGFDYRLNLGIADHWIKWIKELKDEDWSMGQIYYELTNKRQDEKTISYAECHDQAMVGDKTIIFRLMDKEMYYSMNKDSKNLIVDRGIALHKMIRLLTICTAGNGYLNFMGNEFGHPEWIDFPREGNNWSYAYARRQWNLVEDTNLRYIQLKDFDQQMIKLVRNNRILSDIPSQLYIDDFNKILIISRGKFIFVFNFHPTNSYNDFSFVAPEGEYKVVLDSDMSFFGGFDRNDDKIIHYTENLDDQNRLKLYIPNRTALVLKKTN